VEPAVVFTTSSDIEARVVSALLESHGVANFRLSGDPQAIWPMAVSAMGAIRIAVGRESLEAAARIIESHREELGGALVPLRDEFASLEATLGYRFRDRGLLEQAMTHRSRAVEDQSGAVIDNESLEFLGDAVLGLVVADSLYRRFPTFDEGVKSKIKASVVSTTSLARHAEALGFGAHLLLGRGEDKTGGRAKPALLANAFEAVIAAIYLDAGLDAARAFLERELGGDIEAGATQAVVGHDYKSALQERVQALGWSLPEYRVSRATGPDHRKQFTIEVLVAGEVLAEAVSSAKKPAEQEAARQALAKIDAGAGPQRTREEPR
jgi:ribonuclease III